MDFQLSEEQGLLRDTTRDLLARAYDTERRLEIIDSDPGFSRDVWKQLAEIGIDTAGIMRTIRSINASTVSKAASSETEIHQANA